LTITHNGIVASNGRGIAFTRDAFDRISKIVDPNGNQQLYQYDAKGDLVSQVDLLGFTTKFTYAGNHFLQDFIDPKGNRVSRTDYDAQGRVVSTTDPFGHTLVFSHDLDGRREVIYDKT